MNFFALWRSWFTTSRPRSSSAARRSKPAQRSRLQSQRLETRDLMATWDGNGGNGSNTVWSAWSNWNPNVVPHNGDSLVFQGTRKLTNWNDLNLSIQNIIIQSNGFRIDGNAINLGSGGIHFVGGSTSTWGIPLNVSAAETPIEVYGSRTFYLTDAIYGSGGIGKYGVGTAVLSAVSTYNGPTNIYAGTLNLTGALANSDVVVSGGLLTGSGSVKSIDLNGGTVAPGSGIGRLTATSGATLDNGVLQIELSGTSADQLLVTGGDVTLGGTLQLSAAANFRAAPRAVYALVNNTGPGTLTGTFANYAEGQSITLNGQTFEIHYGYDFGGDGNFNDVVLLKPNAIPVAAGENFALGSAEQLAIDAPGLLANDSDADGDALAIAILRDPEHGTLMATPDGGFVYVPDAGFAGDDSFVYEVSDGHGGTAAATANLTVTSGAIPVVGANTFATVSTIAVDSRLRVTDADSPQLTYQLISGPRQGTLQLNTDGTFTYSPGNFRVGTVNFTFAVSDGSATVQGVATINVEFWNGSNIRPDVLRWILANNPGLPSNFLKTEKPDRVILLPDGRSTQIYKLDQFLNVNFKLDFKSRQAPHVNQVQRWEWELRRLLALPEFYYWIKDHANKYQIGGLGTVSAEKAYSYIRNISKTIFVTADPRVKAPVGGGNGINAPSWAVWEQMNLFWHEACHVINIGHNSGGLSGPLADKLRDWDRQERWNYATIDLNAQRVPQ